MMGEEIDENKVFVNRENQQDEQEDTHQIHADQLDSESDIILSTDDGVSRNSAVQGHRLDSTPSIDNADRNTSNNDARATSGADEYCTKFHRSISENDLGTQRVDFVLPARCAPAQPFCLRAPRCAPVLEPNQSFCLKEPNVIPKSWLARAFGFRNVIANEEFTNNEIEETEEVNFSLPNKSTLPTIQDGHSYCLQEISNYGASVYQLDQSRVYENLYARCISETFDLRAAQEHSNSEDDGPTARSMDELDAYVFSGD